MPKGEYLGEFEQLVLLALVRLGKQGYGMTVRREIEATSGRSAAIGSVYVTLERLEKKGLLTSVHAEADAGRGNRARRVFHVEPAGLKALAVSHEAVARMWEGVVVEGEGL